MKKKFILSTILISMLLFGCNKSNNNSSEDVIPDYDENPDGYVDVLPDKTSDGNILHCFNWSFNQIKENLPAIKEAGFKSVQTSPVQQPKSNGSSWWAFYQPLSFAIADNSPLGTKQDLKDLCTAAEEMGISVICDIVFNHMANIADGVLEPDQTPKVCPDVATYEPDVYAHRNDSSNATFHHNLCKDNNAEGETQNYPFGDLPDLNTSNTLVQNRSYSLLKECIDAGVDGFRFDAAKHIETNKDGEWASKFWESTLVEAQSYYKTKTGKDLYAYGEILGSLAGTRDITGYTDIMDITDDGYGGTIGTAIRSGNAERLATNKYGKTGVNPSKLVTWVESHDTYTSTSSHLSDKMTIKAWAVVASRKDTQSLYFARPNDSLTVASVGSYLFENPIIASVNRFSNRYVGSDEVRSFENTSTYINQRFNDNSQGALIVELSSETNISLAGLDKLTNGIYYDQITGKKVTVHNGKANIELDNSGVCILTKSADPLRPTIDVSLRGCGFVNSLELTINAKNATTSTYSINGGQEVSFTKSVKITLNETSKVTIKASNAKYSCERSYNYTKYELIPGYFNIVNINPTTFNDNEIYMWMWGGSAAGGTWSKNYTIQNGVLLVNPSLISDITGFLLGVFPKGYVITDVNNWDNHVIRQTGDISGSTLSSGFFDANGL